MPFADVLVNEKFDSNVFVRLLLTSDCASGGLPEFHFMNDSDTFAANLIICGAHKL